MKKVWSDFIAERGGISSHKLAHAHNEIDDRLDNIESRLWAITQREKHAIAQQTQQFNQNLAWISPCTDMPDPEKPVALYWCLEVNGIRKEYYSIGKKIWLDGIAVFSVENCITISINNLIGWMPLPEAK